MHRAATKLDVIRGNLRRIRQRMTAAAARAGRSPGDVRLIVVTKAVGEDEVRMLVELGCTELAENRVESAVPKIAAAGRGVRWHMIGHVQRRKARDVAEYFDRVDSADRLQLAEALEARCAALGKVMPVLLEVNISGEESKGGFAPDETGRAIAEIRARMPHLAVEGLMTMAPLADDPEETRPVFAGLRKLRDALGLNELSMGMTNDFEVAIEEGATEVRIGSAIFKGLAINGEDA
jgi:hypothetical protein